MKRNEGETEDGEIAVSQTKPPNEIKERAQIVVSGMKEVRKRSVGSEDRDRDQKHRCDRDQSEATSG